MRPGSVLLHQGLVPGWRAWLLVLRGEVVHQDGLRREVLHLVLRVLDNEELVVLEAVLVQPGLRDVLRVLIVPTPGDLLSTRSRKLPNWTRSLF